MKNCYFLDLMNTDKNNLIFEASEKIYNAGQKAVIYTSTDDRAKELDRFLWVHKQETFLPHKIFTEMEDSPMESLAIVVTGINPIEAENIILDEPCEMEFACFFKNIYDFADRNSRENLTKSRERYRIFKEAGYTMIYDR